MIEGLTARLEGDGSVQILQRPTDNADIHVTFEGVHASGLEVSASTWSYAVTAANDVDHDQVLHTFLGLCRAIDAAAPPDPPEQQLIAHVPRLWKSTVQSRGARPGPALADLAQALAMRYTSLANPRIDARQRQRVVDALNQLASSELDGALVPFSRTGTRGRLVSVIRSMRPDDLAGLRVLAEGLQMIAATLEMDGAPLNGSHLRLQG